MTGPHEDDVVRLHEVGGQILVGLGLVDGIDGADRGQFTSAQYDIRQRLDARRLAELTGHDFQVALGQGLQALRHRVKRLGPENLHFAAGNPLFHLFGKIDCGDCGRMRRADVIRCPAQFNWIDSARDAGGRREQSRSQEYGRKFWSSRHGISSSTRRV